MVIPGFQSSTARGAVPVRSHHPVLRVDSPQDQLWGWLGSTELPSVTIGANAAANPDPGSARFPSMGQALGCLCCPGWEGAEGNTSQDASNTSAADPRQVSAFSKQFLHLRINPLNTTANQNKPENPSLHPQPMKNHWMCLVPICSLPLGQATTLLSPMRGPLPVELQVWWWQGGGRGHQWTCPSSALWAL